ncbi:M23 family metallopeptidase [Paenibacillus sp. LHD-117]|uniref:M23 family metallopeptidase n=1 Tax=Paenibacillus sp. LHD-117 TaxID=3071412 RepID=UPI0027E0326B|nr:M23 family metallopeptidase [Paenibacillus sp. LHD-117]MDQ6419728.1 M23 family metallopeptidase [Paenibacillus sp. LHD-117]
MNWLSKQFTFVIIPDANQSVQRFRLNGFILVLVPSVIALLAVCSALFIILFGGNMSEIRHLKKQLAASESGYAETLQDKENHISSLEADLTALSAQAEQIETKMSEITELELQLKKIAGIKEPDVHISSATIEDGEEGGQGGEEIELPASAEPTSLASQTEQEFVALSSRMEALRPSLEATKSAMLKYKQILDITPTIWPADNRKITSTFGVRRDPFSRRSALHAGLDIGGNRGDPIYAAADGVVTLSERAYPQGNNIIINHGRGIETRYMHLNERLVKVGDKVKKGQLIGELGNTGRSTGPHLHYEVIVNGTQVDPMPYIQEDRKERE